MTATLDAPARTEPGAAADDASRRSGWSRWRVAARLARRQAGRTKGSSALVTLLVFLPVAAMAGGAIFWQSHIPTAEQSAALELGANEAWIEVAGGPDPSRWQAVDQPWDHGIEADDAGQPVNPVLAEATGVPATVPPGSTVFEIEEWGALYVETATGIGSVTATTGPVWDPAFAGRFVTMDGAPPAGADGAMVSPGLLARLGAEIGDDVVLVDTERAFTITGILRRADAPADVEELFLPESAAELVEGNPRWFVEDWQPGLAELEELNHAGYIAYARDLVLDPPPGARTSVYGGARTAEAISMLTVGLMVAVFSGYLVVLLAGAAFAVAARRQERSLAVAASLGASRADISRIVTMQGTALGTIGGVTGIVAGAALAWGALGATDSGAVNSFWGNWGYNVPWPVVAAIAVFAMVVGTLSAIAPARAASRGDVLGALRGSRRPALLRARRPVWGSILMISGLGATIAGGLTIAALDAGAEPDFQNPLRLVALLAAMFGPLIFQIGFLVAGHWVLATIARPLSRVGLAPRIASRDAAANPSRVVPAFAAIAGCVFIASFVLSATALTATANSRGYSYLGPLHSAVVSMWQNGVDDSGALLAAAEELVADTEPRDTVLVQSPAMPAYDPETGMPVESDTRTFAVAGQPTAECDGCGGPTALFNGQLWIVEPDDLATLLDHEIPAADLEAFASGAAVTTAPGFTNADGDVEVGEWTDSGKAEYDAAMMSMRWDDPDSIDALPRPLAVHELEARFVDLGHGHSMQVVVSPETAASLGMTVVPAWLVATYDEQLSTKQLDRLTADAEEVRVSDQSGLSVHEERGPDPIAPWLWLILGVAVVLVVGASAVCLGLARFERRPDDATLSAVGGGPLLRRNVNAWQAATIVGIGAVVGTAVGLVPVWGLTQSAAGYMDLADIPWPWLGVLAFALPLAITAVAWLVRPRHPDLTRRTAIT